MNQELEKEFDEITTGRDRMCDEFTRKDVKSFIDTHYIARSEVVKMIEGISADIFMKLGICRDFMRPQDVEAFQDLASTLKKRI